MTNYPSPEKISPGDMIPLLAKLHRLLSNLPDALPLKPLTGPDCLIYAPFIYYQPDPESVELTGNNIGALNMYLEHFFGFAARTTGDGIVPLVERGPGVCAIHTVLLKHYTEDPSNNITKKWVIDLLKASEKVYNIYNTPLPTHDAVAATVEIQTSTNSVTDSRSQKKRARAPSTSEELKSEAAPGKKSKGFTIVPAKTNTKGRKEDDLCKRLVSKIIYDDGKQGYACVAPKCTHNVAGNIQRARVLGHSTKCKILKEYDSSAYNAAIAASVNESLGTRLEASMLESNTPSTRSTATVVPINSEEARNNRLAPVTPQGTLTLIPLQIASKKAKASERKNYQNSVDHIITRLICVRGLVPNILDTQEWKELIQKLNPIVEAKSANTFRDDLIPKEAAFVRDKQIALLQREDNLTLTFDGTSIRRNESFYTAHATTPQCNSYLLDAHEGSRVSHNRSWIKGNMMDTMEKIGIGRWAALCSDNTAVTKAARRDIVEAVPTLSNIWDCVHHIQNTIKDITGLLWFKRAMQTLKAIIKYFSKSSYGTFKLREAHTLGDNDGPVNTMQKIGKTRFGTHWLASSSVLPCLSTIRNLVMAKVISFKNKQVQGLFANRLNNKYNEFELILLQYTTIVAPLIRSLWSLEAAHANAADVFIFWLASAATLKDLFEKDPNVTGIPRLLANDVTNIYNQRYAEFFRNEIYFVAFLLDPRYSIDDCLKLTINISAQGSELSSYTRYLRTSKYPQAYDRLCQYLRDLLKPMLELVIGSSDPSVRHPVIREMGVKEAASSFKQEVEQFSEAEMKMQLDGSDDDDDEASMTNVAGGPEEVIKINFVIDPLIDINSHALLDMVSLEPVVAVQPTTLTGLEDQFSTSTSTEDLTVDQLFEGW